VLKITTHRLTRQQVLISLDSPPAKIIIANTTLVVKLYYITFYYLNLKIKKRKNKNKKEIK